MLNNAWQLSCKHSAKQFQQAIENPRPVQEKILLDMLSRNQATKFGGHYRFDSIRNPGDYRDRLPLQTYDSLSTYIESAANGKPGVLTQEQITRLLPSSGSSAARKLIPCTHSYRFQFNQAIAPWIHNLLSNRPGLKTGRAFWSVSPKFDMGECDEYAIPIGFDNDSEYLNRWSKQFAERLLAVPSELNRISDIDEFRYQQLLHLLACEDLTLISIWHPGYLTLLLNDLPDQWDRIIADLGNRKGIGDRMRYLAKTGHESCEKLWPNIKLISCWGSAHAAGALTELRGLFPNTEFQEKGLLATEAVISIPVFENNQAEAQKVLAVNSHFLEFLQDNESVRLADELVEGESYRVVVTTGSGLYRYQMQDRIAVTGKLKQTPTIEFVGKEDSISDYCGEKLADSFVARKLQQLLEQQGLESVFTMLAPDQHDTSLGYTLYIEANGLISANLAGELDAILSENPHYKLCRELGQLTALRVFHISAFSNKTFIDRQLETGRDLGNIKPITLSNQSGWSAHFQGSYL
ncbi:MAG: GH3 auxin-responsive promoter family protein [Gammaproteobacteria bacterium]|nr:GH3 auxin-responsive promoter family protein [Gammaproteobacteria bacterium]